MQFNLHSCVIFALKDNKNTYYRLVTKWLELK